MLETTVPDSAPENEPTSRINRTRPSARLVAQRRRRQFRAARSRGRDRRNRDRAGCHRVRRRHRSAGPARNRRPPDRDGRYRRDRHVCNRDHRRNRGRRSGCCRSKPAATAGRGAGDCAGRDRRRSAGSDDTTTDTADTASVDAGRRNRFGGCGQSRAANRAGRNRHARSELPARHQAADRKGCRLKNPPRQSATDKPAADKVKAQPSRTKTPQTHKTRTARPPRKKPRPPTMPRKRQA